MNDCGHDNWGNAFLDKAKTKKGTPMEWRVQKCKKCGRVRRKETTYTYSDKLPSELMK